MIDTTRQLKLGADRAKQRTDLEMLDDIEVVRVVDAAEAGPEAGAAFEAGAPDKQSCARTVGYTYNQGSSCKRRVLEGAVHQSAVWYF